jgi:hypothetical protein
MTFIEQENTKLIGQNKKLKEDSQRESDALKGQIEDISNKWRDHVDKETAMWSERLENERVQMETATNQKLKVYETMNDRLCRENKKLNLGLTSKSNNNNTCNNRLSNYLRALLSPHTNTHKKSHQTTTTKETHPPH